MKYQKTTCNLSDQEADTITRINLIDMAYKILIDFDQGKLTENQYEVLMNSIMEEIREVQLHGKKTHT